MNFRNIKTAFCEIFPIAFSIPFLVVVFAPLELYFGNQQEFWFDLYILIPALLAVFCVCFIFNFALLYILKKVKKQWYEIGICIEFIIFFCLYIQGNFFVKNLPALDGREIDWTLYHADTLLSILLWGGVIAVVLIAKKYQSIKLPDIMRVGMIFFILVLTATLITLVFTSNGLKKKQSYTITQKNMFEMSYDENFIILLLDALDSMTFSEVLNNHPEYLTQFSDFTYYPDTMGGYPFTSNSVPFILSGEWFENQEPFEEYCADVYRNSAFLTSLERKGYKLGLYEEELRGDESIYRFDNLSDENAISSYWSLGIKELQLALFKYAPYGFKQYFYFDVKQFNDLKSVVEQEKPFTSNNTQFYEAIKSQKIEKTDAKCFRYIHIEGAHVPFQYDESMNVIENGTYEQNIEASMTIARDYIKKLKESNVYDNSVIIIMADHGYSTEYRQCPLFMIKGRNEKKKQLTISEKAFSYADILSVYDNLLNGDTGANAVTNNTEPRRFLFYRYLEEERMEEYMQTGFAWDESTLVSTGKIYSAELKDQSVMNIDYLSNFEKVDVEPEIHIDLTTAAGNIGGEDENELIIYGWARDPLYDTKAKLIYAEVDDKLYEAEAVYRADLKRWKNEYSWCGFKVSIPKDAEGNVKIHVITEKDQALIPWEVDVYSE